MAEQLKILEHALPCQVLAIRFHRTMQKEDELCAYQRDYEVSNPTPLRRRIKSNLEGGMFVTPILYRFRFGYVAHLFA